MLRIFSARDLGVEPGMDNHSRQETPMKSLISICCLTLLMSACGAGSSPDASAEEIQGDNQKLGREVRVTDLNAAPAGPVSLKLGDQLVVALAPIRTPG